MTADNQSDEFINQNIKRQMAKTSSCPICDCSEVSLLSPSWKRYFNEKEFYLAEREWFASCSTCSTIFRYPLLSYDDYRKYGEDYYNQVNPGETVEEHAVWHFESFQKPNYDSLRSYLNEFLSPVVAKRWLDVGSVGYVTTFDEYEFTTIEPDERVVSLGKKLFQRSPINRLFGIKPRIYCNTIENFEDNQLFDGVVFNNSFYCLPFPIEGLRKAASLLKPNGNLIITISTYFCDAVPVRTDGLISRIEDILQGETLWVFHNPKSLEYLAQKAGFELISSTIIPAYGEKTMRLFHLRKTALAISPNPQLLNDSKAYMEDKLERIFQSFLEQSTSTLKVFNTDSTFFVGTLSLLHDLAKVNRLDKIAGYIIFDSQLGDCQIDGVRCISWDKFSSQVEASPGKYSVVIASYKYQDEVFSRLGNLERFFSAIFRPNRKSGMESLFCNFSGKNRPNKGITLNRVT